MKNVVHTWVLLLLLLTGCPVQAPPSFIGKTSSGDCLKTEIRSIKQQRVETHVKDPNTGQVRAKVVIKDLETGNVVAETGRYTMDEILMFALMDYAMCSMKAQNEQHSLKDQKSILEQKELKCIINVKVDERDTVLLESINLKLDDFWKKYVACLKKLGGWKNKDWQQQEKRDVHDKFIAHIEHELGGLREPKTPYEFIGEPFEFVD